VRASHFNVTVFGGAQSHQSHMNVRIDYF